MINTQKKLLFLFACLYYFSILAMESSEQKTLTKSTEDIRKETLPLLKALWEKDVEKTNKIDLNQLSGEISLTINTNAPLQLIEMLNNIYKSIPGIPQEEKLYEKIYTKSHYFKFLLTPFIQDVINDFEQVTGKNIDTITDQKCRWENLNPAIKKFIFDKATDQFFIKKVIAHEYRLKGHTKSIKSIDVCPVTKKLVSASEDGNIRIWDLTTGTCYLNLSLSNDASSVCFGYKGEQFAVACQNNTVHIHECATGKILKSLEHPESISSVSFSSIYDKPTYITFCKNKQLSYTWNLETEERYPFSVPFSCGHRNEPVYHKGPGFEIKNAKNHDLIFSKKNQNLTLCEIAMTNDPHGFQALFFSNYVQQRLDPIEKDKLKSIAGK